MFTSVELRYMVQDHTEVLLLIICDETMSRLMKLYHVMSTMAPHSIFPYSIVKPKESDQTMM